MPAGNDQGRRLGARLYGQFADRTRLDMNGNGNSSITGSGTRNRENLATIGESHKLKLSPIAHMERQAIIDAFAATLGNVVAAVYRLGLGQATAYRKIKAHEIPRERQRPRDGATDS